jgi:hypothetical protein
MKIRTTIRQAKLKPERADRHPTLPAGIWTSATGLAALVALSPGQPAERARTSERDRPLSDADFEFRGGSPTEVAACLHEPVPVSRH